MSSLNKRIKALEELARQIKDKLTELSKKIEGDKPIPHSKVKKQTQFENMNLIFDDIAGIWKTYGIYKDDE